MPRQNKTTFKNGSPVDGRISTLYIRFLGTYTTVISGSTQFGQGLHPLNFGTRAVEFCDLFEEFRWLSLKCKFLAAYSSATSNPVMSIVGITATENLTAAPTTAAQIAQFDTAHSTFLNQTIPVGVNVPLEVLRGHQDWYSANNGGDNPAVYFAAGMSISTGLAVAGAIQIMWEGVLEFKGASDPSVSVQRRLLREGVVEICDCCGTKEGDAVPQSNKTTPCCSRFRKPQ